MKLHYFLVCYLFLLAEFNIYCMFSKPTSPLTSFLEKYCSRITNEKKKLNESKKLSELLLQSWPGLDLINELANLDLNCRKPIEELIMPITNTRLWTFSDDAGHVIYLQPTKLITKEKTLALIDIFRKVASGSYFVKNNLNRETKQVLQLHLFMEEVTLIFKNEVIEKLTTENSNLQNKLREEKRKSVTNAEKPVLNQTNFINDKQSWEKKLLSYSVPALIGALATTGIFYSKTIFSLFASHK